MNVLHWFRQEMVVTQIVVAVMEKERSRRKI